MKCIKVIITNKQSCTGFSAMRQSQKHGFVQSQLYKAWIDYIDITQRNTIFPATLNSLARAWPSFKELHLLQQGVSFRYFASHGELVESIFRLFNLFPNLHINVDSGCSTFFNFFFALQVRRNFLSERQCGLVVLMEFQALNNSMGKSFEEIRVE